MYLRILAWDEPGCRAPRAPRLSPPRSSAAYPRGSTQLNKDKLLDYYFPKLFSCLLTPPPLKKIMAPYGILHVLQLQKNVVVSFFLLFLRGKNLKKNPRKAHGW